MEKNEVVSTAFNGLSYLSAFVQDNEVLQIIGFVLSILTSLILIAYRIWKWWKEASADGKIDNAEKSALIDILVDSAEDLKNKTEERKDK